MKVILFGNRGSRPIGVSENSPFQKYGGDTTSVGVLCGDHCIALDTGSGFYKWQYTLENFLGRKAPYDFTVLYSHFHDDHTAGLPQSFLLFQPQNKIRFYGPEGEQSGQGRGISEVFRLLAGEPRNPDLFNAYQAEMDFRSLPVDRQRRMSINDDIKVTTLPVDHGGIKALGYRIDHEGQSFAMISDVHHKLSESGKPLIDARMAEFIRGCDAFAMDSHFTDEEFMANPKMCQAFGHSTGEHGVRLCHMAGVPLFIAHHHNPAKTDAQLDAQLEKLKVYGESLGVKVIAAKPSMCLDLSQERAFLHQSLDAQDCDVRERYLAISGL